MDHFVYLTSKKDPKWIINLNIRPRTWKPIEKKTLQDRGINKNFLKGAPGGQGIR